MSKHIPISKSRGPTGWLLATAAATALSIAAMGQNARATVTVTTLGSFTLTGYNASDTNPLNAKVTFSYVTGSTNGDLYVTIANNSVPDSDAELIRDILFNIGGITPVASSTAAYLPSGATELTDGGSGSFSVKSIPVGSSTALSDDWTQSTSSGGAYGVPSRNYFDLAATHSSKGKPTDFVGPSILAGSSPYANYADGNSSVQNSSPILAGPVTFELNIAGLGANSAISNVYVGYGTSGEYSSSLNPSPNPAPEPSVLAFLGMGAIGSLMFMRKRH